jgi:hypothetical protein
MTSNAAGLRWVGHPLLGAFAAEGQLTAYVRFTIWDTGSSQFVPLPAGIDVSLMDSSPLLSNDTIATVQTDANGVANFNIVNMTPLFPDMYFAVKTSQIQTPFAGQQTFPAEWSTKGWRSKDGMESGYKQHFSGTKFGTSAQPIEFEVGVCLFFKIQFESTTSGKPLDLLANTHVKLIAHKVALVSLVTTLEADVDSSGKVEFFSFDIPAGFAASLKLSALNDSTGKGFPFLSGPFVSDFHPLGLPVPLEFTLDSVTTTISNVDTTSLGSQGNPHVILLAAALAPKFCAAFTSLTHLAELNALIHYTALADWQDFAVHHINIDAPLLGGMSWPLLVINLPSDFNRWRAGQMHEFSHQLLWKWGNYSSIGLVEEYFPGQAYMDHEENQLFNPEHALMEGWATIFQYLASANKVVVRKDASGASITIGSGSDSVVDSGKNAIPSAQLNTNWGESVEGVFAAAMHDLFRSYIMPPWSLPSSGPVIPATTNGDITQFAHLGWLTENSQAASDARNRFKKIFVEPAKALANLNNPTTTDFLDAIRNINAPDWNTIRPILQNYFLAFPQIERIDFQNAQTPSPLPLQIPSSGATIVVFGRHFVLGTGTEVRIDGALVPWSMQNSGQITCQALPRPAGTVSSVIIVMLPDGDDILIDCINYV